jgi:hypothetical protein
MKTFTIFVAIILSFELLAQTDKLEPDLKGFISSSINIYEPNPIHKLESEQILILFQSELRNFPNCKMDTNIVFKLLLENSVTSYEDTQEAYRYVLRRCLIYSSIAMSVKPDQSDMFIDLAKKSLQNNDNKIDSSIADVYAGVVVLELLIKKANQELKDNEIQQIKDEFELIEPHLDKNLFDKGIQIIEFYKQH